MARSDTTDPTPADVTTIDAERHRPGPARDGREKMLGVLERHLKRAVVAR